MPVAKRKVPTRSRLAKADPPAAPTAKDDEDDDKKKDDTAGKDAMEKADDEQDPLEDDQDGGDDDDGDDEDMDDEDMPIGQFRLMVLPNGNIRIHPDDLQGGDDDEDAWDEDDSDDADKSMTDDDDAETDQKDPKDAAMGKSAATAASTQTRTAVTEESLKKALKTLMDVSKATESVDGGHADLLRRARSQQGISKSEARALFGLSKSRRSKASLADNVRKSFADDEELAMAQTQAAQDSDVAGYLESLTERTCKSTAQLAEGLQAQIGGLEQRIAHFNGVLAKAVGQGLAAQKLISERMGVIEAQPVRARKSLAEEPVQAARKSFAGAPSDSSALSKSELLETLTRMNVESVKSGRRGLSKGNLPLMDGIERAMQDQPVDPGLMTEALRFRQAQDQ